MLEPVRRALPIIVCLLACGCGSAAPIMPTPESTPKESLHTEHANLLLFPIGDAESLLGRAVKVTEDGSWTIAGERAPGCEVKVSRSSASYRVQRRVDLGSLTSLSAGFAEIVNVEARYGASDKVDIDITNTMILKADTRGDCGEVIVDTVFVGRGKRGVLRSREAGAGIKASIGSVRPEAGHSEKAVLDDVVEWSDDQGYGFTYKHLVKKKPLQLSLRVPARLREGDSMKVTLKTSKPAWLVVYYLDQTGKGVVLWPSVEEPAPSTESGMIELPSEAERSQGIELKAALLEPGKPTREMLVAYAFSDKKDFDRVKPPPGEESDDGGMLAAKLTRKVRRIPLSRWARSKVHYIIEPKSE